MHSDPLFLLPNPLPLRFPRSTSRPSCPSRFRATAAHIATADGARLLTLTAPSLSPSVSTAILLHDFMTDHRLFTHLTPALRNLCPNITFIAYDLRGYGRSSEPNGPYSRFEDLATVANSPSHPLHLIAVGMSGPVALEYAIQYPHLVRSVTCVGSGLPGYRWPAARFLDITPARERALWSRFAADFENDYAEELVKWKQAFIGNNDTWGHMLRDGDRQVTRMLLEMARDYRGFHFFEQEEAEPDLTGDEPLSMRLGEVSVPVLVMVGEKDTDDFKEIAKEIVGGVQRGTGVVTVPGAGHFAVLEKGTEVAEHIERFWNSIQDKADPPTKYAGTVEDGSGREESQPETK